MNYANYYYPLINFARIKFINSTNYFHFKESHYPISILINYFLIALFLYQFIIILQASPIKLNALNSSFHLPFH